MSIKKFPKLYKLTSTGKTQEWQIIAQGDEFHTVEGLKDGKLTTSKPTKCFSKNVGKKNETSPEEQAIAEAQAKWQKKVDKGYSTDPKNVTRASYFEPMLAEAYKNKDTMEKEKWIDKHVWQSSLRKFVQPKLDGLRSINKKNTLMSREGKPFVTCAHLLQNEFILDGELYNHKYKDDFNAIVSMIKRENPSADDIAHAKKYAEMWVYDMPSHPGTFSERYTALMGALDKLGNPNLVLVPTYEIFSESELEEYHKDFRSQGYEGTILRMDAKYENKRTKNLIKYKDWIDEEFEIVGYEEGEGGRAGTIGKFILKHDVDPNQTFSCNVKGDFEYLEKIWMNRECYIGKSATVQYANRTPKKKNGGNVPRHGYVIKIDRESYE